MAVGGEEAPLDKAREVRSWAPNRTWPLSVNWGVLTSLALNLVISGVPVTDLVSGFMPRVIVGLLGNAALYFTLPYRYPYPDGR